MEGRYYAMNLMMNKWVNSEGRLFTRKGDEVIVVCCLFNSWLMGRLRPMRKWIGHHTAAKRKD